jgi:hypothetical protein
LRSKDDDDDTWLWLGLSGSPIASILRPDAADVTERGCWSCAAPPPLDAHAADATETDFLLALAAAPPLAYDVAESVC